MSLNQRFTTEFSPCTPSAPHSRDLSIQTARPSDEKSVYWKSVRPSLMRSSLHTAFDFFSYRLDLPNGLSLWVGTRVGSSRRRPGT